MKPTGRRPNERGAVLIVSLCVIAILGVLAITFHRMLSLEQMATAAYEDKAKAQLAARAGIEFGIAYAHKAYTGGAGTIPYTPGGYSLVTGDNSMYHWTNVYLLDAATSTYVIESLGACGTGGPPPNDIYSRAKISAKYKLGPGGPLIEATKIYADWAGGS